MLQTVVFDSILGGVNPTQHFGVPGGYSASIGIDPDFPLADSGSVERSIRTAGVLRPVAYEAFDGSNVTANPIAIITCPKTALVYVVLSNGRLISYSSSLGSETLIGTVSGNAAQGAAYHNNY